MAAISSANAEQVGANRMVQLVGQWSTGDGPLYRQLATAVSGLIEDGTLRAGTRLPPERTLAASLSVSRGTVVRAYDHLAEVGVLTRVQGSGTTVAGRSVRTADDVNAFVGERLWMPDGASIELLKAMPTLLDEVAPLVTHLDLALPATELDGSEPLGWWRLRERIAELHTRQGLTTTPHQILVTTGAQQALSLVANVMARPGDVVLGEELTWPGVIDSVRHAGGRYEPVRVDADGILTDDLEAKLDRFRPALLVVNPQHQNPTGARLPVHRVEEIAALAKRYRVPVLEDRVAADLGFDRRRLPAVDEFDTGGYGLIAGSICKVAWPGLRLGWLRGDAQVINRLRSYKAVADMFTPVLSQVAGLAVLEHYDGIVDARLTQLRPSADLIVDALRERLPEWAHAPVRGGLSVWVTLPEHASASAFVRHAGQHGVLIASGRQFSSVDADSSHIRIPFTAPPAVLAEAMDRLVEAWQTFDRRPAGATID